jgi:hypothetical protein
MDKCFSGETFQALLSKKLVHHIIINFYVCQVLFSLNHYVVFNLLETGCGNLPPPQDNEERNQRQHQLLKNLITLQNKRLEIEAFVFCYN